MFMSALQAMSHMSLRRAASFADLKGTYDMMQHYLKAVTMPAPRETQVCHASHHGTQVCCMLPSLGIFLGLEAPVKMPARVISLFDSFQARHCSLQMVVNICHAHNECA